LQNSNNTSISQKFQKQTLVSLFNFELNTSKLYTNFDLFQQLFNACFFVSLLDRHFSIFFLQDKIKIFNKKNFHVFDINNCFIQFPTLIFYFKLNFLKQNIFKTNNYGTLNKNFHLTTVFVNPSLDKINVNTSLKGGLYGNFFEYETFFFFIKNYKECSNLTFQLLNQINFGKEIR
jgi:hypothetical protein